MELKRNHWLTLAGVVATLFFLAWTLSGQVPDDFTNLKVFPQDIGKKELVDQMKSYSFALGARCWGCHDGQGDDLSTFDFASDIKPTKAVARKHIEMTQKINETFFAGQPTVTCGTCHNGQSKPKN